LWSIWNTYYLSMVSYEFDMPTLEDK
jgi:hypothetical protein